MKDSVRTSQGTLGLYNNDQPVNAVYGIIRNTLCVDKIQRFYIFKQMLPIVTTANIKLLSVLVC
jgi:hypothetical protein